MGKINVLGHALEVDDRARLYIDGGNKIAFVENVKDGPDGYDVFVGPDHFYLQSRILPDLTMPEYSTADVLRTLTNINSVVPLILQANGLSADQLHIALLKVRQRELKEERDTALEQAVKD